MTDPFSIALGALTITQTCVKITKTLMAMRDAIKNGAEEVNDAVKEILSLKSVCESVHLLCQKINKSFESQAIWFEDSTRLRQLCGALAVSVGDCEQYSKTLELLFLRTHGSLDAQRTRISVSKGVVKQLLKKDELQDIRRKITTHHTSIQSQVTSLSSFNQTIHMENTKRCLTISQATNESLQNLNASMHSMHLIIDQYIQPVACSDFRPSLFGVCSIPLVDIGTRYVGARQTSSQPSSVNDISLPTDAYEYGQDSFASGDHDKLSVTSVPFVDEAHRPQLNHNPSTSKSIAKRASTCITMYLLLYPRCSWVDKIS